MPFPLVSQLLVLALASATAPSRVATAGRALHPLSVDGHLDEPDWASAPRNAGFVQRQPRGGAGPSQPTWFKVLFDEQALYVGIRCDDDHAEQIEARLTRRDREPESDRVGVALDARHDHISALQFMVNAAGVQVDELRFDDTQASREWDGLWASSVSRDPRGWTVEMRIPLSELRFETSDDVVMGLQVFRYISRLRETDVWAYLPPDENAWVSRFGELRGLGRLSRKRTLTLIPYGGAGVITSTESGAPHGRRPSVGLDARYPVTGDMNLDVTALPDFGQVEADEQVVNLGQFETFYPEKRPFFQEGRELLSITQPLAGNNANQVIPFYSRRIGLDKPIFAATKLTGRAGGGFTLALLDALVWPGMDPVDVTQMDNLSVQRVTWERGETTAGLLMTQALRPFHRADDETRHQSLVAVTDLTWKPMQGAYLLTLAGMGSANLHEGEVTLGRGSIQGQAPWVEPGGGAKARAYKAGGSVVGGVEYEMFTPRFDVRDLGYQQRADMHHLHGEAGVRLLEESRFFRDAALQVGMDAVSTFAWQPLRQGIYANGYGNLKNGWSFGAGAGVMPSSQDDIESGDGRIMLQREPSFGMGAGFGSDPRQVVTIGGGGSFYGAPRNSGADLSIGGLVTPISQLELGWTLSVGERRGEPKLATETDGAYVFALRDANYINAVLRGTFSLTHTLSLQAYAQGVVSDGSYRRPVSAAKDAALQPYGARRPVVDPYRLPAAPASTLDGTGYHEGSLVTQLVLRHEFRPGSVVYVVYMHNSVDGELAHRKDVAGTFTGLRQPGFSEDRLEAKISVRLGL